MQLRAFHVILAVVLGVPLVMGLIHYSKHGVVNSWQVFLSFFAGLNTLICFWELALAYRIDLIQSDFAKLLLRVDDTNGAQRGQESRFAIVGALFMKPMARRDVVSLSFWSQIWSTYSIYDPSYANKEAFGFFIDCGNGHSTLLPSILWLVGMTYNVVPARAFGLVGLVVFYQELYGTVVYFASFCVNKRYRNRTALEVALFVGLSNGLWIFGPATGMVASLRCVYDENYTVFGNLE
ncbi:hypothetical protein M885DRAFT_479532 [Pelagophyceae sp. CCMP2097]|nr:hypothetical protein M885DRAFT_479532 [Pelagophyceae sp. CCMP2097]